METHIANILKQKENQFALQPGTLGSWLPLIQAVIDALIQILLHHGTPPAPTPTPTPVPAPANTGFFHPRPAEEPPPANTMFTHPGHVLAQPLNVEPAVTIEPKT